MARFTRLQYWQIAVFAGYWFIFFPIIWFLIRPDTFASTIWGTVLFALILLALYLIIYFLIKCCCKPKDSNTNHKRIWTRPSRRGAENPVYSPTTTSNGEEEETRVRMPDAVVYENTSANKKPGLVCQEEPLIDEERKNVRFITSCSLYYDGQDFHDFK
ncbi:hypothetical protein FF38_10818 [Lucilia cuprina]|uniref:Uncharacterized protein n=1 Tax=Lucilia cuprina TaxID=7375 RepID=A0A0L0CN86_LUCCU|nr:uncharacterized protein LOC111685458 [Lucilia cuprina]KNC33808.1 hypothetical protein FF38_10818 [Lucilia cuprina]